MRDSTLEGIALCAITIGLIVAFFFVLDYEPADALLLSEDDSNVFVKGMVTSERKTQTGKTMIVVNGCRMITVITDENSSYKNEYILAKGSFSEGVLFADLVEKTNI